MNKAYRVCGYGHSGPVAETPEDAWRQFFETDPRQLEEDQAIIVYTARLAAGYCHTALQGADVSRAFGHTWHWQTG